MTLDGAGCEGCADRACAAHPGSVTLSTAEDAARNGMGEDEFRRLRVAQTLANAMLGDHPRRADLALLHRRVREGLDPADAEREIRLRHGLDLAPAHVTYVDGFTLRRLTRG